jgi:hypothetical protein
VAEVEILEREIGLVGRVPQPCFRSTARPALTAIDGRKQLIRQQERAISAAGGSVHLIL